MVNKFHNAKSSKSSGNKGNFPQGYSEGLPYVLTPEGKSNKAFIDSYGKKKKK